LRGGVSRNREAPLSIVERRPLVRIPRSALFLHDPHTAARVADTLTARIEMLGVSKSFPGVRALDRVDFSVRAGEVHALMGENGAGKSTLIKIMTGAVGRDEGEIRIDGAQVDVKSPGEARALGVGTVYQEVNLIPTMSVTRI
jgi:ABC-type sugar transport system ATPase subunit